MTWIIKASSRPRTEGQYAGFVAYDAKAEIGRYNPTPDWRSCVSWYLFPHVLAAQFPTKEKADEVIAKWLAQNQLPADAVAVELESEPRNLSS